MQEEKVHLSYDESVAPPHKLEYLLPSYRTHNYSGKFELHQVAGKKLTS